VRPKQKQTRPSKLAKNPKTPKPHEMYEVM
jgi:hypothetical protein